MSQEGDGLDEAVSGIAHVSLIAAGRAGEMLAREAERRLRESQARSEQAAAEMRARIQAETQAARAFLEPVHREEWWDAATGEEVARAYTAARAWGEFDPRIAQAEERIVHEVRERFGVDLADADEAAAREAIERAERDRAESDSERGAAQDDRAEAAFLVEQADALDRQASDNRGELEDQTDEARADLVQPAAEGVDARGEQAATDPQVEAELAELERELGLPDQETGQDSRERGALAYDSAERREGLARSLDHIEDRAAVQARLAADVAQGRPAAEAVASAPGRAPRAKKGRGKARGAQVHRTDRGR